jgi:hypothetical protein
VTWDQKFFDPILLPDRKPLVTLRDAALYITKLPKGNTMQRNGRPSGSCCTIGNRMKEAAH